MADSGATLLDSLAAIAGEANVLTAPEDVAPFLNDWRGRFRGAARAVVRPGSTTEVAAVVAACARQGVGIVPQGGNTGLCGGAIASPQGDQIVLSLHGMQRVRAIDVANATITVEAGMPLAAVQQAAAARGLHFPLSLGSEGSCTIGGNLSTNAGGTAVLRFGNARDLTLGLEVVLADGRVMNGLRGLRKDNTGYDLKQLFIGAEGTLGIVTAAVLKLFPALRSRVTALAAVPSPEAAVALLGRLKGALGDRLTGFEIMSGFCVELSRRHHQDQTHPLPGHAWYTLVQADDSTSDAPLATILEAALAAAVDDGEAADAVLAQSEAQAGRLWALRENITEAQRREGPNVKHDISLPVSAIPQYMMEAERALAAAFPAARLVVFGHLGDGNLHYNVSAAEGDSAQDFIVNTDRINHLVHQLVAGHGGSFSAEHGIGQLKRDELVHYKSGVELALMRTIKAALDPEGIMNPGKVL